MSSERQSSTAVIDTTRRGTTPTSPDEIEGEVVWIALRRCGSDAHYHTEPDDPDREYCHHLDRVPDERVIPLSREEAERRDYAYCQNCEQRAADGPSRNTGELPTKDCPLGCGAEVKFVHDHLRYECARTAGDERDPDAPPTCPECGADDFATARGVGRHRLIVHGDDDDAAQDQTQTHAQTHTGPKSKSRSDSRPKSHECPECDRDDFGSKRAVGVHRAIAHEEGGADETTICPECGADDFSSERGMRIHLSKIHDETLQDIPADERVPCPTCGREDFASEAAMRQHHTKTHGYPVNANSEECERCGGWFTPHRQSAGRFCSRLCSDNAVKDRPRGEDGQFIAVDATEGGG